MVEQEIEYSGSKEDCWGNPLVVCFETPVSRQDEPHIERTDNGARRACQVVQVARQPILNKWTGEVSHKESKNDEPQ